MYMYSYVLLTFSIGKPAVINSESIPTGFNGPLSESRATRAAATEPRWNAAASLFVHRLDARLHNQLFYSNHVQIHSEMFHSIIYNVLYYTAPEFVCVCVCVHARVRKIIFNFKYAQLST